MITLGQCKYETQQYEEASRYLEAADTLVEKIKDEESKQKARRMLYHTLG